MNFREWFLLEDTDYSKTVLPLMQKYFGNAQQQSRMTTSKGQVFDIISKFGGMAIQATPFSGNTGGMNMLAIRFANDPSTQPDNKIDLTSKLTGFIKEVSQEGFCIEPTDRQTIEVLSRPLQQSGLIRSGTSSIFCPKMPTQQQTYGQESEEDLL